MTNEEFRKAFGERITRRRLQLSMTQEELALKLGYKDKSSINKIEKGLSDIPQSKIIDFADALQCTKEYLMGWDIQKNNYSLDRQEAEVIEMFRQLSVVEQSEFVIALSKKVNEAKKENPLLSALQIG